MNTLEMNVNRMYPLVIGWAGEKDVTEVVFDYSAWIESYGDGDISLVIQRPDEEPYEVNLDKEDGLATWTVSDVDTSFSGKGQIQLKYTVNENVKKSAVTDFIVHDSINSSSQDVPEAYETWFDQLTDMSAQVRTDAESASRDAETASEATTQAQSYAESAEESAVSASQYATQAGQYATNASNSATIASDSASSASASAESASASAESGGAFTLDDVPKRWKEAVETLLEADE